MLASEGRIGLSGPRTCFADQCIQRDGLIRAIRPGGDASTGLVEQLTLFMPLTGPGGMTCWFEVLQGQGMTTADAVRQFGATVHTDYRWWTVSE